MNNFCIFKEFCNNDNSNSTRSQLIETAFKKEIKNKIRQKSKDTGLARLTMKFIKYIKQSGQTIINLKDVEQSLKVRRRRIYDITNVIEGLGYIKKISRSRIIWSDKEIISIPTNEEKCDKLEYQIKSLEKEAALLQLWNNKLKDNLNETLDCDLFKEFGYLIDEDIKKVTNYEDLNLVAIRAPKGTTLEMPDDENVEKLYIESLKKMINGEERFDKELLQTLKQKYQIFFNSIEGDIKVYLILASNQVQNKNIENSDLFI